MMKINTQTPIPANTEPIASQDARGIIPRVKDVITNFLRRFRENSADPQPNVEIPLRTLDEITQLKQDQVTQDEKILALQRQQQDTLNDALKRFNDCEIFD